MALFEITPEIQRLAEPVAEGWHPAEIHKVAAKLSNSGSKMVLFTFKINGKQLDGDANDKDKFAFHNVNNDYLNYSIDFLSVISGVTFNKKEGTKLFQSEEDANKALKGKKFEIYVQPKDFEGRVSNNVTKIRQPGKGKAA